MQIASTILDQLGGNKFLVMTGARNIVAIQDGLMLSLPRGMSANKANKVGIKLSADNTYTVEFYSMSGINFRRINALQGVHAEDLAGAFSRETGLATSL